MSHMPPSLLLISWNRSAYLEKTLANLLADPADFRVYWWDNASEDERTRELFETTKDERIVVKHRHEENVGQREPCLWFFDNAESDIVGKIDDDILLPHGWTDRIAPMLRAEPRFGMLCCWIFMPEEWDEGRAAHSIIKVGSHRVYRTVSTPGCAFLARREYLLRHLTPLGRGHGLPVDRAGLTRNGFINGKPLPMMFAEHMDDPASPHCLMRDASSNKNEYALTMRKKGFTSVKEYSAWIRNDVKQALDMPFEFALQKHLKHRRRQWIHRVMQPVWLRTLYKKTMQSLAKSS